MYYINTMEYYSHIKEQILNSFIATWVELEITVK